MKQKRARPGLRQRNPAELHSKAAAMSEREKIRAALTFIPAHDRELWIRIGMAIKSALNEAGFDLWDRWSQQDQPIKVQMRAACGNPYRPTAASPSPPYITKRNSMA
jgi:hypothetical protein